MKAESIKGAISLAQRLGHVLVATADAGGVPHIAVAGKIAHLGGSRVSVDSWFCPATLSNLQVNHHISVVVWDRESDSGYQLIGESEKIVDRAMMDGYTPAKDDRAIPQVEREIIFRLVRVIDFMRGLHSDME